MIFNNKLKVTKEKKSTLIAAKRVVFILIFLGLTTLVILQKTAIKLQTKLYWHSFTG